MTTIASDPPRQAPADAHVPSPPSERGAWLLAIALCALGVGVLIAVLTGVFGRTVHGAPTPLPPTTLMAAATPIPGAAASASVLAGVTSGQRPVDGAKRALGGAKRSAVSGTGTTDGRHGRLRAHPAAIVAGLSKAQQSAESRRFVDQTETHITTRWMEGFYPIYTVAQRTFGVNWLLLASIHMQESAFSTDPTTYHGLNFAGCCGGPMQFNVRNGGRDPDPDPNPDRRGTW